MNVRGSTVFFGGTTQRTNDPNLVDAVYFSVQDNGDSGAGIDQISLARFSDSTTGNPNPCMSDHAGDFSMMPVDEGNIQVK